MQTDIQIAGIKSNFPAYSVAWQINETFDMQLCMSLNWEILFNKTEKSSHLHFYQQFEDVELNWHLVQNKGDKTFIFKSNPTFDYFIICHGEDIYGYFNRLISALSNAPLISNIFAFPFSKVKPQDPIYNNLIETKQYISDYNVQNQF